MPDFTAKHAETAEILLVSLLCSNHLCRIFGLQCAGGRPISARSYSDKALETTGEVALVRETRFTTSLPRLCSASFEKQFASLVYSGPNEIFMG